MPSRSNGSTSDTRPASNASACWAWWRTACCSSSTPCEASESVSSRLVGPNHRSDVAITMPTEKHDWSRADAMTDAEVHAAAMRDPDARPMTDQEFANAQPVPRARTLRQALGVTQEGFAARFQIPLNVLRDWEQGRAEPDQIA